MTFKELLIRHLRSAGFQRRFRNIYLPFLKEWLAAPYNRLHTWWFEKWYQEQVSTGEAKEEAEYEDADGAVLYEGANIEPLQQEDAVEVLRPYLLNHERQNFGMCVTHTVKNIFRFAAKAIFKGYTDYSEHDIYLDRTTRAKGIDNGMNSSATLDRIIEKGVAIAGIVPDPEKESDLNTERSDYPDEEVDPFRIKLLKSREYVSAAGDFDKLWDFITATYAQRGVRPFQFSITSYAGWWKSDVPTATGSVYGGHSVMGLTIPFLYRGKRAFFAVDSSFRNGLVWSIDTGIRIVTEDCWNGLGRAFRPVEFVDPVEKALGGTVVVPVPKMELLSVTAQYGQSNEHVTKIQKALIAAGFDIPAITTGATDYGYYGQQTADAVLAFHTHFAPAFAMINSYWTVDRLRELQGKSFGDLSVQVMNGILKSL